MKYIRDTLNFHVDEPTVITFGKFDGLHRGHEYLMEKQIEQNLKYGYKRVVFTFDIPPKNEVLKEKSKVITTNEEKYFIFEKSGVDYLIECPFNREIMTMSPENFIKWIVKELNVKCIIVGNDFCFGYNRAGNYELLEELKSKYGYELLVVEKVKDDYKDISSTYIREEILNGNIKKANQLLGYPFFIRGNVIRGNQIGRTIGIPTINIAIPQDKILPPLGVYVSKVWLEDEWYMGVSNIGRKPTVGNDNPIGLETYIIDFNQNVYDKLVSVEFFDFIRPEIKFDSIEKLKEQMSFDINRTIKYYKNVTKIC